MSDDVRSKQRVCSILEQYGFQTAAITEEPGRRTADIRATQGPDTFIFEIKDKNDDPEEIRLEEKRLRAGEFVNRADSVGPRNRIAGIIRDAAGQLSAYKVGPHTFRLLWFNAVGRDANLQWITFYSTLYGTKYIHDFVTSAPSRECYYFEHSAFSPLGAAIDAAVAFWTTEHGTPQWALCLNGFSPRSENMRRTALYGLFAPPNDDGLYDPEILEKAGKAYLADTSISRRDPQAILKYIRIKYQNPNLTDQPEMNLYSGRKYFP